MKIVISGFYGSENTGDEAILSTINQTFSETYPDVEFTVLSLFPERVEEQHGVNALYRPNFGPKWFRTDFREIFSTVREADVVLIGGGGLLQDAHSQISIARYLQTALLAEWVGTPTVYYAIGVGPVTNPVNRMLVKRVCELADKIIVRDQDSRERMKELGVNTDVNVAIDPVFTLEPTNKKRLREILEKEGIPTDKSLIGVSVRDFGLTERRIEHIARFLEDLTEKNRRIVFIPFGYEGETSDLETSRRVRNRMRSQRDVNIVEDQYRPKEVLRLVGQMDFFVGMRLHSVIMAATQNIPILGISYLPKVKHMLLRIGYDESEIIKKLENCTQSNLKKTYENIITRKNDLGEVSLPESIDDLRTDAEDLPREIIISNSKTNPISLLSTSLIFVISIMFLSILELKRVYFNKPI